MSQTDSENYARCLLPKGHGYPFWIPRPNDNLCQQYLDRGLDIGDVGTITYRGAFDFLFNICLPADHPINAGRTPPGFKQVILNPLTDVHKIERVFPARSHVASLSVTGKIVEGDFSTLSNPQVLSFLNPNALYILYIYPFILSATSQLD
jgi:hypothetical protein